MVFSATNTPQRLPRSLRCPVQLLIQVKQAGTIALAREQGDAQGAANGNGAGVEFTNANTSGAMQPQTCWWQGDVWYVSVGGPGPIPFVLELLSEEGVT